MNGTSISLYRIGALGIFLSLSTILFAQPKSEVNTDRQGLAIKGYDPVTYHTEGAAQKGVKEYELEWKGATWRFSSAENLMLFEADPEAYAPQYGGYCAWAVSQGYTAGTDPKNAWRIVEGKLYLNYNGNVQKRWETDISGHIEQADLHWPKVLQP